MRKIIALFIVVLAIISCSKSHYIDKSVAAGELPEPAYFQVVSFVDLVQNQSEEVPNDSLSAFSGMSMDSIIRSSRDFRVTYRMPINDRMLRYRSESELVDLVNAVNYKQKINGYTVPPITDSILKANKQRYATVIYVSGFKRTTENLENRFKDKTKGIFKRMDNYMNAQVESRLTLYAIILDSEKNKVLYFSVMIYPNVSPVDKKALADGYKKLLKGYLRKTGG